MPGIIPTDENLLEVLEAALAAQHGVLINTDDPTRLRLKLYAARNASGDRRYQGLNIRATQIEDGSLAIVKAARRPEAISLLEELE